MLIVPVELFVLFAVLSCHSQAYGLAYSNYTSEKHRIAFQYPTDWTVDEKTNRFQEQAPITITDNAGTTQISVLHRFLGFNVTDIGAMTNEYYNTGLSKSGNYDVRLIEPIHLLNIDNHSAASFVAAGDRGEETGATQIWMVAVDNQVYSFVFVSTPDTFDSPESTEIRNHFINSVNFLGAE